MAPNKLLKAEREKHGWSQAEVATRINAGEASYFRWETLGVIPTPYYRRQLSALFGKTIEGLGLLPGSNDTPSGTIIELKDAAEYRKEQNEYLQRDLGLRLLSIVDAGTYDDQRKEFEQIMEQFDATNTENQNYELTRRQAVISLVTFPFVPPINLMKKDRVPSSYYELFLQECGASLAACSELESSNPDDRGLAFQCVSRYLVELKVIANSSSRYRQQALELATHCAIRKNTLGYGCASRAANSLFAQDAIDLAFESGNICLILSAYDKQAWDYLDTNQIKLALDTATRAKNLLEQHERQQGPLLACIRGGIQSDLSLMQARNRLPFDTAFNKANEQDPGDEDPYNMEYTRVWVPQNQGRILYYARKTKEAMAAYEQLVNPETLAVREPFQETLRESWRIKTILGMAYASMKGAARDKGNAIRYWKAAIEGAKRMKHQGLCVEALTAYDLMEDVFPDEQEVYDLHDHIMDIDKSLK